MIKFLCQFHKSTFIEFATGRHEQFFHREDELGDAVVGEVGSDGRLCLFGIDVGGADKANKVAIVELEGDGTLGARNGLEGSGDGI